MSTSIRRPALAGLSALLAGVLLLLVGNQVAAQATTTAKAIREAREALRAGHADRAVTVLQKVTRNDPGAIDATELLARAFDQAGRGADARRTAERILRAFPQRTSMRLWLAQFLERSGALAEALPHYARVVRETKPATPEARLARLGSARTMIELGSPSKAREVLAPLTGPEADDAVVLLEIRALRREGNLEAAIRAAKRHVASVPAVTGPLASLLHTSALAALASNDLESASRRMRESAALVPNLQVDLDLARVLERQGKNAAARTVLRAAAARAAAPEVPAATALATADALCAAGCPEEGLRLVQAVHARGSSTRDGRLVELRCLSRLGRESAIRSRLEAMMSAGAADAEWQAAILLALRDSASLSVHVGHLLDRGFRPARTATPTWIHLLRKAGRASLKADDPARARRFLGEARRLAPNDPAIGRELGWAEFAAGHHDESLRLWASDLESADAPPDLLAAAARCHHAAGRLEEAIAMTERASSGAPASSEIRRLHWRLLDEAGRTDELIRAMDPDRLPAIEPADAIAAASILARRRLDPEFGECLDQWVVKQPDSAEITRVAARACRDRARTAQSFGKLDSAVQLARRTALLAPDAAWAHRELADVLVATGDLQGALPAYREALRLDPAHAHTRARFLRALQTAGRLEDADQVVTAAPDSALSDPIFLLAAVRLCLATDQARRGESMARKLISSAKESGDNRSVARGQSLLVSSLVKANDIDAALDTLEQVILRRPDDTVCLQRYLAISAWSGKDRRLVGFLRRMERAFPAEVEICSALARHHMGRKEQRQAVRAIKRCLELAPEDPAHWSNLGRTELERGNNDAARLAFERARSLVPDATWLRFGLAEVELNAGNYPEVIRICDQILTENPWLQPALWLKVRAYQRAGDTEAALRTWDSMYGFMVDESEHYLVRARILHGAERFSEARQDIEEVLARCRAGVLPILLYHGVSDDMQPATIHDQRLRDHLRALRAAGYVSIGLQDMEDWLAGKRTLPDRAVLITFDDARLDNVLYADAPLREFGYTAVQFVPTARVETGRTFHMSWHDLRNLLASGRWEVGAHGHRAHDRVGIDADGASSPYLAACRWLKGNHRLESREEFEDRIDTDYRLCEATLERELGLEQVPFYSFSFNDFGQREISNAPWIFEVNEQALTRYYRRGFHQSGGAYNIRSGPGMRYLARLSVPPHWTGVQLVEHLRRNHPEARARLELGRLLSWMGEYEDALRELALAEKIGAEPTATLKARANTLLWRGNDAGASDTFRRLLDLDPTDAHSLEVFQRIEHDRRPSARASFDYWWDSDDRGIVGETLSGEAEAARWLRLIGSIRHATYIEKGTDNVSGWTPRVGAEASFAGLVVLKASIGQSCFSAAKDQVDYSASVRWQGIDRLALSGDVAGGAVQTASAINAGIRLDAQSVLGRYQLAIDDQVALSFRNAFYSDGNDRQTVRIRYTHRLSKSPTIRVGLTGTYDDTRDYQPEYYTPRNLHQYQAYVRLDKTWDERLKLTAQVAGGWGVEDGDGHAVGQGYLRFTWQLAENLGLNAEVGHQRNPGYYASYVNAGIDFRF